LDTTTFTERRILRPLDAPAAELADDGVPLDTCGRDGDLPPHGPVLASPDDREELGRRGKVGYMPDRAAHRGARGLVLGPDVMCRLTRQGEPAACLTGDLDQDTPVSRVARVTVVPD
jgi:hypothetical protein